MIKHVATPVNNLVLSSVFHQMASCYRYMGEEQRFRAVAYEKVARVLQNMKEDIAAYAADIKSLDAIGGIGESIAAKIMEYFSTGHIQAFEKLKERVPFELLDLMDVNGIGPATVKALHDQLHVDTKAALLEALESNQLASVKGFPVKKTILLQRALKVDSVKERMPLTMAVEIAGEILEAIKKIKGVMMAVTAGSIRRKKETIGDIDILIVADPKNRKRIAESFVRLPQVAKVLAKGITRASVVLKNNSMQVDIRIVNADEFGAALLYFTGSKEHNIKLRTMAHDQGYKINEYGIFDVRSGRRIAGETEEGMYRQLKMQYIPPEKRLDKGEIENALQDYRK